MTLKLDLGFQMWKVVVIIGECRIFLGGLLKNEFIRICNDWIAVKTHPLS